ncbi:MAG: Fur family transcriptional regulator [Planctomycetota bacterium]
MKHAAIIQRFEDYLRQQNLRMTPQRRQVFDKAFETHDHFSAETMYEWLKAESGAAVSRATVYRTLDVLQKGGFIEAVETGNGVVYEHILGHEHHDHMVCTVCGGIEEFRDEEIEALQRKNAEAKGFMMTGHMLRLSGICGACVQRLKLEGRLEQLIGELAQ